MSVLGAILVVLVGGAPTSRLTVEVEPGGGEARVWVDGEERGVSGEEIEVTQTLHEVRVSRVGYWDTYGFVKVGEKASTARLRQVRGVPMEELSLVPEYRPELCGSGTWSNREKTPWMVYSGEILMSPGKGYLPGTNAPSFYAYPEPANFALSCEVLVHGSIREFVMFGQRVPRSRTWVKMIILVIGKREYLSLNMGRFRRARTVTQKWNARYPRKSRGSVRIRRLQWVKLSEAEALWLKRMYHLSWIGRNCGTSRCSTEEAEVVGWGRG